MKHCKGCRPIIRLNRIDMGFSVVSIFNMARFTLALIFVEVGLQRLKFRVQKYGLLLFNAL